MKTLKNTKYLLLTLFFALIILLSTLFMPKFAKADTTTDIYNFNSSNIFIPIKSFNGTRDDNYTSSGLFNYQMNIGYDIDGYYLDLSKSSLNWIHYLSSDNRTIMYNYSSLETYGYNLSRIDLSAMLYEQDIVGTMPDIPNNNSYGWARVLSIFPNSSLGNINITDDLISTLHIFTSVNDFIPNLVKVEFGNFFSDYGSLYGPRYWNFIKYINTNGDFLRLSWYVGNSWCIDINNGYNYAPMESLLESREYYFNTEFTQDVFFNNGYSQGKSDGYKSGYDKGSEVGYINGFNQGELKGYADGVNSKTDYSFLGLFTALIDAPIQALFGNGTTGGLFNFEFLGINLAGFYLSLFTIMIVLAIVKIVMKGG